jgi:hypothetical protein
MSYIDIDEYVSTPRTTDPAEIIAEKNIAIGYLARLLAERDAELAERERFIGALLAELSGIDTPTQR